MVLLESKESGDHIPMVNIYAVVLYSEKIELWDSLDELKNKGLHQNCVIEGDFNTTLSVVEKRGGNIVRDPSKERIEDLITQWDLFEVIPKVRKFTWSNRRMGDNYITARLYIFLIHSSWILKGSEYISNIKAQGKSDHYPITLQMEKLSKFWSYTFPL